jgi:hypothetical protein
MGASLLFFKACFASLPAGYSASPSLEGHEGNPECPFDKPPCAKKKNDRRKGKNEIRAIAAGDRAAALLHFQEIRSVAARKKIAQKHGQYYIFNYRFATFSE